MMQPTCQICPSTADVRLTDVGLRCCAECRTLFGFEPVDDGELLTDNKSISVENKEIEK